MTAPVAPVLWIGTCDGLLRWQAGALTPVFSDGAVTALARLPGGRIAAGLANGELLVVDREGHDARRSSLCDGARMTSLLVMAGHAERWLAATDGGALRESRDGGASFASSWCAPAGPLEIVGIPGRPRSALLFATGQGGWLTNEPGQAPQRWVGEEGAAIVTAAADPLDGHVWLARTATQLLRSNDGARSFKPVAGWPATLRPRLLHFSDGPRRDAFAIAFPLPTPPDPGDPSPVWKSVDGGQLFHPVATRLIDHARDPVGELTAITSWFDHARHVVLGSDRGELLEWDGDAGRAHLLADELPPIDHLLATGAAPLLDPSSSGVFLLP